MSQINNQVRQNLVSNNYLHSNKFNFYNASLGGPNYAKMLENFEESQAKRNIQQIQKKMEIIVKKLQMQEEKFYNVVQCTGPTDFTDKYLRFGEKHDKIVKEDLSKKNQGVKYYSQIISREVGLYIIHDKSMVQYILGYDLNKIKEIMEKNVKKSENNWNNELNIFFDEYVKKYGFGSKALFKLQEKAGTGQIIIDSLAIDGKYAPCGGAQGSLKYAQKSLIKPANKMIEFAAEETFKEINSPKGRNKIYLSKGQKNLLFSNIDQIALNLIKEYKLEQYKKDIMDYINRYTKRKVLKVFDNAKAEMIRKIILEKNRKVATGDALEIGVAFIMGNLIIPDITITYEATGTKMATTDFYHSKATKNKNGFYDIEYYQTTSGKEKLRQDGIMRIVDKNGKMHEFGFQMKNSFEEKQTVHLGKNNILIDTLVSTMYKTNAITNEQREELLYMLTNFYYFKNNPEIGYEDTETIAKSYKDKDNSSHNYSINTSASLRYISILLQAGLEMIIEPELEKYTEDRINRINSELNTGKKSRIAGNNFFIIHNVLVPVSYFFLAIIDLTKDYQNFLKEQTNSKYFTINEPDISNFNMISAKEMWNKKRDALKTIKNTNKKNWQYPQPLLGVGADYGHNFIDGAKLTGYNIFLKLDDLYNQVSKMDINLGGVN